MLFRIEKYYLIFFLALIVAYSYGLIFLSKNFEELLVTEIQLSAFTVFLAFLTLLCTLCLFSTVKIEAQKITHNWVFFKKAIDLDQVSHVKCHKLHMGPCFFLFYNQKKHLCFFTIDFFDMEASLRRALKERKIEISG